MLKSMVLLGRPPFFWTLETNCNAKAGIPMAPTIFAFKGKRTNPCEAPEGDQGADQLVEKPSLFAWRILDSCFT